MSDENVFVRLPLVQWQQTKGRVGRLEEALRAIAGLTYPHVLGAAVKVADAALAGVER